MKNKRTRYTALANGVIAAAKEGAVGDWAAYIMKTEGKNHYEESGEVLRHGTKLDRRIAEAIFPDFKDLRWRE